MASQKFPRRKGDVCTAYSDWRCFLIIDVLGGHGITGTPTPCFWRTFLASFCSESGSSSNVNNNANLQCLHLQIWDCLGQPSDHAILFLKHKSSNKFFSTQSHSLGSSEFGIRRFVHRAKPHMFFKLSQSDARKLQRWYINAWRPRNSYTLADTLGSPGV